MRLQVMGSFALANTHGELTAVTAPRLRLILAILSANYGRVVPAHRLIELVWGETPPATAETSLHVSISQLRKMFEPSRPARTQSEYLISRDNGYVLELGPRHLDLALFEQLAEKASSPGATAEQTLAALAVWRDPPLGEFADAPWALAKVAQLRGARAELVRANFARIVDAGLAGDVVDELAREVAANPQDQRLAGLLMVVHYRNGRHGDALAAYETLRVALADSGLEPMVELRNLHRAVLTQDPRLMRVSGEQRPQASGPLVDAASTLVGRAEDVTALAGLLGPSTPVTVVGAPGVGKSRLVRELAQVTLGDHRWCLVDVSRLPASSDLISHLAAEIGLVADPLVSLTDAVVGDLAATPTVLVLDNADEVVDEAIGLVSTIATNAEITLVVTSRQSLGLSFETVYKVEPLAIPSPYGDLSTTAAMPACRLLVEQSSVEVDATNHDDVVEICRLLDGLPLALELAGFGLRRLTPNQLRQHLEQGGQLQAPTDGAPRHRSLDALVAASVDALDPATRRVLMGFAVFGGPVGLAVFGRFIDDVDQAPMTSVVSELVERGLVSSVDIETNPRYEALRVVRSACQRSLRTKGDLEAMRLKHARLVLEVLEARAPVAQGVAMAPEELASELSTALAWLEDARSEPELHLRLITSARGAWYSMGRVSEARRRMVHAVEMYPDADELARGLTLATAGLMSFSEGAFLEQQRLLSRALELLAKRGLPGLEVLVAARDVVQGDLGSAVTNTDIALASPHLRGANRVMALEIAAFARWHQGDPGTAVSLLEEQQLEAQSLGDHYMQGRAMRVRGLLMSYLGSPEAGVQACVASLDHLGDETNDHALTHYLAVRSVIAHRFGTLEVAHDYALGAMERASRNFVGPPLLLCVPVMAWVEASKGRVDSAARLTGWVRAVCGATGMYVAPESEDLLFAIESSVAETLGPDKWQAQRARGAGVRLGELVAGLHGEASNTS